MISELDMYKDLVKDLKKENESMRRFIRGLDIRKNDDDDTVIRMSGETIVLSEAQLILLEDLPETLIKKK